MGMNLRVPAGMKEKLSGLTRAAGRLMNTVKAHAPEICAAGGVIGVVATVAVAIAKTPKAVELVAEAKDNASKIRKVAESEEMKAEFRKKYGTEFDEKEKGRELAAVWIAVGGRLVKNYIPVAIMGTAAVVLFLASVGMLRRRNAALVGTLAAVEGTLNDYRERWKKKVGSEEEKKVWLGVEDIPEKEGGTAVDPETGETRQVYKKTEHTPAKSPYIFEFCRENNKYTWSDVAEANYAWLNAQQKAWNQFLVARSGGEKISHVFLNEILGELGFEETVAGQFVGWTYDPMKQNQIGDDFIDFGITDITDEKKIDPRFILNFNATTILDKGIVPET